MEKKEEKNSELREFKGRNLEDAISLAEHVLKLSRSQLNYEIVAEKTKLFGIKSKEIVIRCWSKEESEESHAAKLLDKMLYYIPLDIKYHIKKKNDVNYFIFEGNDKHLFLRKDAELLLAFQHILNKISNQKIQVDCDFYRKRKEQELTDSIQKIAHQVQETGNSEILDLMNPYERRLVHIAANQISGVITESIGEGFLKRVKIFSVKNNKKQY